MRTLKGILTLLLGVFAVSFTILVLIAFGAYPFLTAEKYLDADILIVEGWQGDEAFKEAADLFHSGNYNLIITTGGRKVSSHYLRQDRLLSFRLTDKSSFPIHSEVKINVSGINGAMFQLQIGDSIIDHGITVSGNPKEYLFQLPLKAERIIIRSSNAKTIEKNTDNIFIKHIYVNGVDIHLKSVNVIETALDGSLIKQRNIDHASHAKDHLTELGVPYKMILASPGDSLGHHRTKHNALGLQKRMKEIGLVGSPISLFTTGIHARRSRILYEQAVDHPVGLIVFKDPEFSPYSWWTDANKWQSVISELGGCIFYTFN